MGTGADCLLTIAIATTKGFVKLILMSRALQLMMLFVKAVERDCLQLVAQKGFEEPCRSPPCNHRLSPCEH
jgi:hypothetical protein